MTIQQPMLSTMETSAVTSLSASISYIGVGTGTSTPVVTQTQLDGETYREVIFATDSSANTFTTSLFLDVTENNTNVVNEIGAFNSSSGPTMISRNRTTTSTKTSSKEFFYDIKYEINATNSTI